MKIILVKNPCLDTNFSIPNRRLILISNITQEWCSLTKEVAILMILLNNRKGLDLVIKNFVNYSEKDVGHYCVHLLHVVYDILNISLQQQDRICRNEYGKKVE